MTTFEPQARDRRGHHVLDPALLGRPVHLLPRFAADLAELLAAAMQSGAWRRNWSAFRLDQVEFGRAPDDRSLRWLGLPGGHGTVGVAFERRLLLGLLNCRYGRRGTAVLPPYDLSDERVSATEERLAGILAQQLAGVLQACLGATQLDRDQDAPTSAAAPGKAAWAIRILVREPQSGEQCQCWLAPDTGCMDALLRGLQPERVHARIPVRGVPLAASLQLQLDARLASKAMPLAALFALKLGDVIPVQLDRADILLDDSRLFTAAVAEHQGKLCLTSFEDAE